MPATLYLRCPVRITKDGEKKACGKPLTIVSMDEEFIYFACPRGHRRRFTCRYTDRFLFVNPLRVPADFPNCCPCCLSEVNPNANPSPRGTITCGECGTQLLWNVGRKQWEVAEVQ